MKVREFIEKMNKFKEKRTDSARGIEILIRNYFNNDRVVFLEYVMNLKTLIDNYLSVNEEILQLEKILNREMDLDR